MLVSVKELEDYMQMDFDPRQKRAVEYILLGLQNEIETFLHRPVEVGSYVERHVIPWDRTPVPTNSFFYNVNIGGTYAGYDELITPPVTVYLKNTPVADVSLITLRPLEGSTAASLVAEQDYLVQDYGVDIFPATANDEVYVHYTGGLKGSDYNHLRGVILRAATREAQNMYDTSFTTRDLSPRDAAPSETGLTESEKSTLKYLKKKRIASR